MSELEIKFQVPPGEREALLKAIGARGRERASLRARYFDTADQLLARNEIALRLRDENGTWVQTLKASTPHSLERLEHNVELPADADEQALVPRPERHDGTEVGERLSELLQDEDDPALIEIYRTEVTRNSKLIKAHDAEIEWSLDEGTIVAGNRVRDVLELELEFKGGDVLGLYSTAQEWQSRHGLWLDPISKAHRGSLLVAGQPFAPAVKARAPKLTGDMDGERMLSAMVASSLWQILPNSAEIAGGSEEPEHVHQARVGLRRLRTAVREMEPFAAALGTDWEAAIKQAFTALGEARDRHVQRIQLAPELRRAGAPMVDIEDGHSEADLLDAARDVIRAPAFQAALLHLLAFAHDTGADDASSAGEAKEEADAEGESAPASEDKGDDEDKEADESADGGSSSDGSALDHVQARLDKRYRQVTHHAGDFESLSHEEQHDVRKRLKGLRYLAQFVAPLYKTRRVEVWLKALEPAQDALGHHIDTLVAADRFETASASDPRAWFAVGWFRGQLGATAHDSRKSLERFSRAAVFW